MVATLHRPAPAPQFGLRALRGKPRQFHLAVSQRNPETVVLRLLGDVDLLAADDLRTALHDAIESGAEVVEVDAARVTFMDVICAGIVVGAVRRGRLRGCRVELLDPAAPVALVLRVTGLACIVPVRSGSQQVPSARSAT